jgi:hypothetical protein
MLGRQLQNYKNILRQEKPEEQPQLKGQPQKSLDSEPKDPMEAEDTIEDPTIEETENEINS